MHENKQAAAADVLRSWALDEELKRTVMSSAPLATVAARVARRYSAGETIDAVLVAARVAQARGHAVSIEYAGESVRDPVTADAETEVFLRLVERLCDEGIAATVSADLSHLGALVDRAQGMRNARRIADALAPIGTTFMISAEGADRTDLILDLYQELSQLRCNVGITLQARLHRTPTDLERVLAQPGPIRLVKGAFLESEDVAYRRDSEEQQQAWLELAQRLLRSGHRTNLATHDATLIDRLLEEHPDSCASPQVEFEMLRGLAPQLLDRLRNSGYATREYIIFGAHWWLYVLNRIAEKPERVFDAIIDMAAANVGPPGS